MPPILLLPLHIRCFAHTLETLARDGWSTWWWILGRCCVRTGYAFHVDVATAYKIITDTFTEREVCELTEIQLYPPQHMVAIAQKGSPLRKMITYGYVLYHVYLPYAWIRPRDPYVYSDS